MNELECASLKPYLWILKWESIHIMLKCHEIVFFWIFSNYLKMQNLLNFFFFKCTGSGPLAVVACESLAHRILVYTWMKKESKQISSIPFLFFFKNIFVVKLLVTKLSLGQGVPVLSLLNQLLDLNSLELNFLFSIHLLSLNLLESVCIWRN